MSAAEGVNEHHIIVAYFKDRDSSVNIATRYGLEGPGDRIQVGARFSAPVQTGREAHPASCKMGTVSFPGVKAAEA